MIPSPDQIGVAAYYRWQRRGGAHGLDREDWLDAEQELLLALNYEIVARYRLDGVGPQYLGDPEARRCRFCEQAPPRATFSADLPALPESLGNTSLFTREECDDCRAQYREAIEGDLERFTRPFREGRPPEPGAAPDYDPIAAFKGLVRAALAILPEDELPAFGDAIEWVSNPDHDLDAGAFRGLECSVCLTPAPAPFSRAALARRVDDEAPMPSLLFFVTTGRATFEVAVPLSALDEDLDGEAVLVPTPCSPPGAGSSDGARRVVIPMSAAPGRRAAGREPRVRA